MKVFDLFSCVNPIEMQIVSDPSHIQRESAAAAELSSQTSKLQTIAHCTEVLHIKGALMPQRHNER